MGEDEVASFDSRVAGIAGFELRLVGGFAVVELSVPPAAGRCVFLRVLDHKLYPVLWGAGHVGLGMATTGRIQLAKDFVVFLGRVETPGYSGNDCALWKRKLSFAIGFDPCIIAQNGADIVEAAFFARHGDQSPVPVSRGNRGYEDRGSLSIDAYVCRSHGRDNADHRYNCDQQESDPGHAIPPSNKKTVRRAQPNHRCA